MNNLDQQSTKIETIVGVVHPHGSGGILKHEDSWKIVFEFYAWRSKDGTVHTSKLRLEGVVTSRQLDFLRALIYPLRIIKVRVAFKDDTSAEFLKLFYLGIYFDLKLMPIVFKLKRPLTYRHPQLGIFVFDRRGDEWTTTLEWAGKPIPLSISGNDVREPENELLQTAIQLFDNQAYWGRRTSDYACEQLLEGKNRNWLDDDEAPLSSEAFKSRISLTSITVDSQGDFNFWYDDDNMFSRHIILVSGTLEEGPTYADIAG